MPHPAILVVDGAAGLLAETEVGFSMVEVKVVKTEVSELVDCEAQLPGDVGSADRKGIVVFWGEGHGEVVK